MAIFQYPFAEDGDRNTNLPNAASLTGLVSFQEGFTPIYETLPSLGGQYIQRRDFNEIVHRICAGVNTLETLIPPAGAGVKILADLATAIGDDFQAGTIYYALNNENEYLLIDDAGVSATDTITNLIAAGKVKNITPLGQGQSWQGMAASRAVGVMYTNTTGRTIAVSIVAYATGTLGNAWELDIDHRDVTCGAIYLSGGNRAWVYAAVPAGSTYWLGLQNATTVNIVHWNELR